MIFNLVLLSSNISDFSTHKQTHNVPLDTLMQICTHRDCLDREIMLQMQLDCSLHIGPADAPPSRHGLDVKVISLAGTARMHQ